MNADWSDVEGRARLHAALADPARLQIVDVLSLGDASPSELAEILTAPSNLVAHHLGVLEREGVVSRKRSEADRRRNYRSEERRVGEEGRGRWARETTR